MSQKYEIDIEQLKKEISFAKEQLAQRQIDIDFRNGLIAEKDQYITDLIHEKDSIINEKDRLIDEKDKLILEQQHRLLLSELALEAAPFEYGVNHPIVRSSEELLEKIISERCSLSRFGDGEFELMDNHGRPWFQIPDERLAGLLKECFEDTSEGHIVAVADIFGNLDAYKEQDKANIRHYLKAGTRERLLDKLGTERVYYDAYVSRPYLMYEDKEHGKRIFDLYKRLWKDNNILLVEGEYMFSGVGNDLFDTAKSVRRIECPSKNAFDYYDEILSVIEEHADKDDLILIGLGPTATVLSYELFRKGYWALDLGQLDNEYEWCLMNADERIPIPGKAVAELDDQHSVAGNTDEKYLSQIVARIEVDSQKKNNKVSVVVPVYNVEKYVEQCVRSIMNQTYHNLEIICLNDGSTDGSLEILRKLEKEDSRILVVDKENSGYGDTVNTGIRKATGEYIGIVESDDFAEPDMFEKLVSAAMKYDAEVVKANFSHYYSDTNEKVFYENLELLEYDCVMSCNDRLLLLGPTIWSGLYNKEFLIRNNIWLLPSPGASYQDTGFAYKVMYAAKRITLIKDAVLNYRCDNADSSVHSTGKVFCIGEEMNSVKKFVLATPDGYTNMPIFTRVKYIRYKWNYDRLVGEAKEQWYRVMHDEFVQDHKDGYLVRKYWPDQDWEFIHNIIYEKI